MSSVIPERFEPYLDLFGRTYHDVGVERFGPGELLITPIRNEENQEEVDIIGLSYVYEPTTSSTQLLILESRNSMPDTKSLREVPVETEQWLERFAEHPDPTVYPQVTRLVNGLLEMGFRVEQLYYLDLNEETDLEMVILPTVLMGHDNGHVAMLVPSPVPR